MKDLYIRPEVEIVVMRQNEHILAGSGEDYQSGDDPNDQMAKKHNFSFYDWEEESDNSLPRSKSVWDD